MNRLMIAGCAAVVFCLSSAGAQGQASPTTAVGPAPGAAQAPLAIANPHYVSIEMEINVNRPATEVWARVGKYCDIGEWFQVSCTILSGQDGQVGVVRSIGNEVMVGKTELSYTYTQPVREGRPYNMYHGTLEARPVTATTCKLVYTLMFDNSMLADDAAREADIASRRTRFMNGLKNMKILAEGGTLPPAPARGAAAPGR
jgi:Polyketide cyclase / dehydrase and lipid transport